ncbi:MAG: electron transport complex protein RnfC [Candidatus Endobugula sp.]|jgi:electron transport complex protein RnfC
MSALIASDNPGKTMNRNAINSKKIVSKAIGEFHGGIYPAENKTQSMQLGIAELPIPSELIFPLNQHMGVPAEPIVALGDNVVAGQKIAAAVGAFSAAIHASSSGVVSAIEERTLPHPSGMSGLCIVIKTDGEHRHIDFIADDDYRQSSPNELIEKIRAAGITGLGGAGFPTAVKLKPQAQYAINTLILNGTECEPYITADHSLMLNHAEEVIKGALLLSFILAEPENILIGVEDNKPDAIAALEVAIKKHQCNIQVLTFPTKYPSGGEKQLIQLLTAKEVPAGAIPASLGIVMQNVGTAVAAYHAVVEGKPLTSRITTFVGEALTTPRNIQVLLGTPIDFALSELGYSAANSATNSEKLIMGGPMMGFALDAPFSDTSSINTPPIKKQSIPVIKSTNCVIAPTIQELPPQPSAQECIRCGMCAEVCPASLLPQQLYWYTKAEEYDRAQNHQLFDCIECGACSYVCPSNIPLVQYYRAAKGAIKQIEEEKVKSDHARKRFEFRKLRMEKAEQEKMAKREARKLAAAKAKRIQAEKLAAQAASGEKESVSNDTSAPLDPVAAAMARVKKQQNDPAAQRSKLERAVSGAKDRVLKLNSKLSQPMNYPTGSDEEHRDRITSQVKQAEMRLQDAEKLLADFLATAAMSTATVTTVTETIAEKQSMPLSPSLPPAKDAASSAIEKAKANTVALASMSAAEKLQKSIESLEQRLFKAQQRLSDAEKDKSEHVDAFKNGAEKLEEKLREAKAKQELTTS